MKIIKETKNKENVEFKFDNGAWVSIDSDTWECQSDEDDDESEEVTSIEKKKKKKTSTTNYGKVSTAINKMKNAGVSIEPPDVNASDFTFVPDVDSNTIIYGLSGIVKIGAELVSSIIDARPYTSIEDFLSKAARN